MSNKYLNKAQRAAKRAAKQAQTLVDLEASYKVGISCGKYTEPRESLIKRYNAIKATQAQPHYRITNGGKGKEWNDGKHWWYATKDFERISDCLTAKVVSEFIAIANEYNATPNPSQELADKFELAKAKQAAGFSFNLSERELAKQVRMGNTHVDSLRLTNRNTVDYTSFLPSAEDDQPF